MGLLAPHFCRLALVLAWAAPTTAPAQTTAEDWSKQASNKYFRDDFAGAIADYTKAIALAPKEGKIYSDRGLAHLGSGNLKAALADFDQALDLDPEDWVTLSDRAKLKRGLDDLDGAAVDYTDLVRMIPDRTGYFARGDIRLSLGQFRAAILDYTRGMDVREREPDPFVARGMARLLRGDAAGALADLDAALKLIDDDDEKAYPLFVRHLVLRRLNRADARADLAAASAKWNPGWPKFIAALLLGEMTEDELFALAADGTPQHVRESQCEAYYYAGMRRLLAGDQAGATRWFEKSVSTRVIEFKEFTWARAELARLAGAK